MFWSHDRRYHLIGSAYCGCRPPPFCSKNRDGLHTYNDFENLSDTVLRRYLRFFWLIIPTLNWEEPGRPRTSLRMIRTDACARRIKGNMFGCRGSPGWGFLRQYRTIMIHNHMMWIKHSLLLHLLRCNLDSSGQSYLRNGAFSFRRVNLLYGLSPRTADLSFLETISHDYDT